MMQPWSSSMKFSYKDATDYTILFKVIKIINCPFEKFFFKTMKTTMRFGLCFQALLLIKLMCNVISKKKKYRLRGRSSETAKAHRG
eukprot:TRINITY_DN8804_c0_g1_i1.p1 TRINITY_DN8804_c0_g1~~TRINITY_DN8804_c0_g1_i1.p1  ORF type:complete len:86 (+),score=29.43 TRINITY_DN8804_c0_g1_i1:407-664(+)